MLVTIEIKGRETLISFNNKTVKQKTAFVKKYTVNDLIQLIKDNKI